MEARDSGVKMSALLRLVKRRVLEGGVGCVSGGRLERSRVRLDFLEADEEDRDGRGVISSLGSIVSWCELLLVCLLSSSLSVGELAVCSELWSSSQRAGNVSRWMLGMILCSWACFGRTGQSKCICWRDVKEA